MLIARAYSIFKTPLVYVIIAGALLQVAGYALLGTIDASADIPPKIYGYEVIAGVGCGISYLSLFAAVPFAAEKRDHGENTSTPKIVTRLAATNMLPKP